MTIITPAAFTLTTVKTEPRIDTRLLAKQMHKPHQNMFELVKDYKTDFEEFGLVRFQTGEPTGGRPERFALLNEDQSYLLLTYTRNTARTRQLKVSLVKAFGEARRAAEQHHTEYLPAYHELHDQLHSLAANSEHEHFVHSNVNRLINKTVGLQAGQRHTASMPVQSLLAVAQSVAASAAKGAPDHHEGYQRIKRAMLALSAVTMRSLPA